MGRYEVHQPDANAAELYKVARKLGFSVQVINRPVDALFGIYDQTVAVEVKTLKGQLEPTQDKFFATFKGMARVIRTSGDVLTLYRDMRHRHDILFPQNPRP